MHGAALGLSIDLALRSSARGSSGPSSDPIIQSLNSNGWSVTTTSNPPTMQPDVAPKFLYANRQGFDQTGAAKNYTEAIVLTQRLRQPYPNQGSLTPDQVVLSDYLYSTDTVIGAVTGTSSETSPKPIANWARVDRRLVGNSFPKEWAEVVAFHRNARSGEQIACVIWTWTDGTNTVTAKVGASVVSGDANDLNAVVVYRPAADVDISSLTAGQITMNAKVYPWIGDASSVLDSSGGTANSREFCPQNFTKNPTLAGTPYYAYVDTGTGNDGTGAVSTSAATAAASPCASINGAIVRARALMPGNRVDGLIVRLIAATHNLAADVTFNTYQDNAEVIVEAAPGVSQASAIITWSANRTFQLQWLRFRGVSLARTGSVLFTGKTAGNSKLVLDNCAYDANSASAALINNFALYMHGVTFANPAASVLAPGSQEIRLVRGVSYGTLNSGTQFGVERWLVLGSILRGVQLTKFGTRTDDRSVVAFDKLLGCGGATPVIQGIAGAADVAGFAFVQNVCEWTSTTSNPMFRPSGDGDTGSLVHLVCHHNTFAGFNDQGRGNILYNQTTGTARTNKLASIKGNIHVQINTKHDVFQTDGTRIQSWPYEFGVGSAGEFSQFFSAGSPGFAPDFGGLNASLGTSNSVRNDPLFTAPAATTSGPSAGAGGGDYTLQAGSPCIGRVKAPVLAFDLAGSARSTSASASGAYERAA